MPRKTIIKIKVKSYMPQNVPTQAEFDALVQRVQAMEAGHQSQDSALTDLGVRVAALENGEPPPPPQPTADLTGPSTVNAGETYDLTVATTNATAATLDGQPCPLNGAVQKTAPVTAQSVIHTLTASNPQGVVQDFHQINVTPPPDPDTTYIGGYHEFEEIHVHTGKTLVLLPGAELVRLDVPPTDPEHGDGGIVVHGHLRAVRGPNDPPIVIRSQNPDGHRGHLMIHGTAELDGVEIRDFGRTTVAPQDGSNPKGRYAVHFHLAVDNGYQSRVENCFVHDTSSPRRYGITIHGTNGVTVRNNVIRNKTGAGIFLEDGTERANIIEGNTIEDITGANGGWQTIPPRPDGRGVFAEDGAFGGYGVYSRGPLNVVRNNIVRRCPVGYVYYQFLNPLAAEPITEFSGNLAEECFDGLQPWFIGMDGVGHDATVRTVFRDFTARDCINFGVFSYPQKLVTYEGFLLERAHVHQVDYTQHGFILSNCTFHDCGFSPSTDVYGEMLVDGCTFNGQNSGVSVSLLFSSGTNPIPPRRLRLRECALENGAKVRVEDGSPGGHRNYVQTDEVFVETAGGTYRAYYGSQAADILLPPTDGQHTGSPTPGLTNGEALALHGVCRAGSLLPEDATTAPWATGPVKLL